MVRWLINKSFLFLWFKCNEGNFFAYSPKLFEYNFNTIIVFAIVKWLRKGWQEVGSAYSTIKNRAQLQKDKDGWRSPPEVPACSRSRGEQVTLQWLPHVCLIAGPGSAQPAVMGKSLLELQTEYHNTRQHNTYTEIFCLCSIIGLPVKTADILEHYYLLVINSFS